MSVACLSPSLSIYLHLSLYLSLFVSFLTRALSFLQNVSALLLGTCDLGTPSPPFTRQKLHACITESAFSLQFICLTYLIYNLNGPQMYFMNMSFLLHRPSLLWSLCFAHKKYWQRCVCVLFPIYSPWAMTPKLRAPQEELGNLNPDVGSPGRALQPQSRCRFSKKIFETSIQV